MQFLRGFVEQHKQRTFQACAQYMKRPKERKESQLLFCAAVDSQPFVRLLELN